MAKIKFKDLTFEEFNNKVRVFFLDNYYFDIEKKELSNIGKFKINKKSIEFNVSENKARKKFTFLINKGFENLKNKLNNKKTIYLHQNMNIPLIGLNYFGIVDRNTSLIEVKPLTGCNFNCIYCSIDEGLNSKKQTDFIIEKDFLVQELKKLIKTKNCNQLEIYINPHGEPLLYKPLIELVKDISKIKEVKTISISTNSLLLSKAKADALIKAGLNKFNLSINAIDEKIAKKMAGINYNPNKIIEISKYIASKKVKLFIAPVWLPNFNDNEIPKIIEFAKKIDAKICIQNFLNYRFGRNPCKSLPFEKFFEKMKNLEKKHDVKLIVDASDFKVINTNKLEKPFKKNNLIEAKILFNGRLKNEKIAVAKNRLISIPNCYKTGKVKLKIVRSKHNIFVGILV